MLDVPEDIRTSEDLDNQITQQSEDIQDYGYSENEDQEMEEVLTTLFKGDPESIIEYLYNRLEIEDN